ncbi:hypothetical protein [Streptomyces sp. NBC_00212]|uniref:hypothetical protein n=1 Tax=Streptomyces sp. NBC_00212 TaxID=2975684 RepID=UPI003253A8E5
MPHEHVVAGIATALRAGALTADAVALEARKWGESAQGSEPLSDQDARRLRMDAGATVTSLIERRLAALPPDPRPLPSGPATNCCDCTGVPPTDRPEREEGP